MVRLHFLDGYEIYPDIFLGNPILHAIPLDRKEKTAFFRSGECFYGTPVTLPGSVLDLKKDGDAVFFRDDIDLSSFGCDEVRLDDLVCVLLEVLYGEKLCLIAGFSARVCHGLKGYSTFTVLISFIFTSAFTFGL